MTNEVSIQSVSERIEYIESLNSRGVGTAVKSQQFELTCLRRLLSALTAQPVKLPESFYGVIQDGKVVMLPADDGQWLNKTSVAEAFRSLEKRAEGAEANLATNEGKQALIDEVVIQALRDDVRQWQRRAEAAEANLAELVPPKASMADFYENVWKGNCAEPDEAGIAMWDACRAAMLRNIEGAK